MASVTFPFHRGYPVVELALLAPGGYQARRRLAVDSGFTGLSALVLPVPDASLADRAGPAGPVSGALRGVHSRVWVIASIEEIGFRSPLLAICANTASLALPDGIDGFAGLSFVQHFDRWSAARAAGGSWSLELALLDRT